MTNINLNKFFSISLLAISCGVANADYRIHINTEQSNGGQLPNGSISFVDKSSGGGNGNGSTQPTEPTVPTEPNTPEEPTKPETKPRSLVFSGSFQTFSGETNLWTSGKNDAYMVTAYTFVLKGALKDGQTYYVGNNGNECPFVAEVCSTDEFKRCGPFTSQNLSGQNTILYKSALAERNCIDVKVNYFANSQSVSDVKFFDGPKTE